MLLEFWYGLRHTPARADGRGHLSSVYGTALGCRALTTRVDGATPSRASRFAGCDGRVGFHPIAKALPIA